MPHDDLLRAATRLRDRLICVRDRPARVASPEETWGQVAALARRLHLAERRAWWGAVRRSRESLIHALRAHRARIEDALSMLPSGREARVPPLREIHADLAALRDEFPEVNFDRRRGTLVVRTEPVELEGLSLGSFDVVLWIDRVGDPRPYDVVAVDPRYPTVWSRMPRTHAHPHLDGDRLCEGDGRLPIARALMEGRPYDVFQLVDRVLRTYNAESAYVSVAEWHGIVCRDCGDCAPPEEIDYCQRCEGELCGDCTLACRRCDHTHCADCLGPCAGCGDSTCDACVSRCARCGDDFCRTCLDDEACSACRKGTSGEETTRGRD